MLLKCEKCGNESSKFPFWELRIVVAKDIRRTCLNCVVGKQYSRKLLRLARKLSLLKNRPQHEIDKLVLLFHLNQGTSPKKNEKDHLSHHQNRLLRDYGITTADFQAILLQQNNKCPICGKIFPDDILSSSYEFRRFPVVVDHCHKSNRIRGLLCPQHNSGLGLFDDSPEYLRAAADYLEKPPTGFNKQTMGYKDRQNLIKSLILSQKKDAFTDHIRLDKPHK